MKKNLTRQRLTSVGAIKIGEFKENVFHAADGITNKELARPGTYFVVKQHEVVARYFTAFQEGRVGFNSVISSVKNGRTSVDKEVAALGVSHVYFIPEHKVFHLHKANDKQPDMFDDGQNFTQDNRKLFKKFNFRLQKR